MSLDNNTIFGCIAALVGVAGLTERLRSNHRLTQAKREADERARFAELRADLLLIQAKVEHQGTEIHRLDVASSVHETRFEAISSKSDEIIALVNRALERLP